VALGRPEALEMNEYDHVIRWTPLSTGSSRRVKWDNLYAPFVGLFHAGNEAASVKAECTPQRLAGLKTRADQAIVNVRPEFTGEADRLRRERYLILSVALAVSLALIVFACLTKNQGYEIVKTFLATGGTGGLLTWGVTLAFSRIDQEMKLRLFPGLFGAEFDLCATCEAYEEAFQRFVKAAEALRGAK
jgi:hypothetical protein